MIEQHFITCIRCESETPSSVEPFMSRGDENRTEYVCSSCFTAIKKAIEVFEKSLYKIELDRGLT